MTLRPAVVNTTAILLPSRDARLIPYCVIAVGSLGATLVTGQPALAALAVPFMLALAIGLRVRWPVQVFATVTIDSGQALEGDMVSGRIDVRWEGFYDARLRLHRVHGTTDTATSVHEWAFVGTEGRIGIPFQLKATQWGRRPIGEVWLRLSAPFGLLTWTGRVATGPILRVLPGRERLTRLLEPSHARAVLGMHRSSRRGSGHEFAELRPYAPGDRLRDVNWGATARHRRPFVNQQHPELSGDVVILVDAFGDGSGGSTEALARAARATWALASVHLRANDRVGLAGVGSATRWLPPAGGRHARYRLLETLLGIASDADGLASAGPTTSRTVIPPAALVIALTHLHDLRTLHLLKAWRARGRAVVVAMIDTRDLLPEPASTAEGLARRVWSIELGRRQRELMELGIPVVPLVDGGPIAPVVSALRRSRKSPALSPGR